MRCIEGFQAFLDGYCSTVQGLLDWFEVDLGFPELVFFRLICVLSVFLSPTLSSRSPLVLFGRLALPLPRGGSTSRVSPQSLESHIEKRLIKESSDEVHLGHKL